MNKQQYLLVKLAEEATELAQIALKTSQFGIFESCPGMDATNIERCNLEFNDVLAVAEMLNDYQDLHSLFRDTYKVDAKKQKVEKYFQYSISLGEVNDG